VWSELSARPKDLRILTVEGDSMLSNPYQRGDIEPGDKVVVNVSDIRPSPPGIFIMYDGLGLVAKRVEYIHHPTHPVVRIMSNNVAYETYERTVEEAFIQGRVVGRWQRL
jgi:acetamidase/formamidase